MNYLLLSSLFVWLQLAGVSAQTGSPVSLTVEGGGSLTGLRCPENVTVLCQGVDLIFLTWRYNDAIDIHSFEINAAPTTTSPSETNHPAFISVTLDQVARSTNSSLANFTSTLTVNLEKIQNVTNIVCGDTRTADITVNVTLLQPTIPTTPNITNITANYQSTGLSSVEVTWRKLGTTCPQFEASLKYEVSAGSGLSQNVSQSSCGESFCTAQFNTSPGVEISLRAFNDVGTSGTATYIIVMVEAQDSGQYFTAQVNITDTCEATARCVLGVGINGNAMCSVQYMDMSDPVVSPLNEVQRLQPNTEYLFVFSVMVDERLMVTVTLENSTDSCGTMMPTDSGPSSETIIGIAVGVVVFVLAIIIVAIIIIIVVTKKLRKVKLEESREGNEMSERYRPIPGSDPGTTADQPPKNPDDGKEENEYEETENEKLIDKPSQSEDKAPLQKYPVYDKPFQSEDKAPPQKHSEYDEPFQLEDKAPTQKQQIKTTQNPAYGISSQQRSKNQQHSQSQPVGNVLAGGPGQTADSTPKVAEEDCEAGRKELAKIDSTGLKETHQEKKQKGTLKTIAKASSPATPRRVGTETALLLPSQDEQTDIAVLKVFHMEMNVQQQISMMRAELVHKEKSVVRSKAERDTAKEEIRTEIAARERAEHKTRYLKQQLDQKQRELETVIKMLSCKIQTQIHELRVQLAIVSTENETSYESNQKQKKIDVLKQKIWELEDDLKILSTLEDVKESRQMKVPEHQQQIDCFVDKKVEAGIPKNALVKKQAKQNLRMISIAAPGPPTVCEALKFSMPLSFVNPVEIFSASSSGGVYKDNSLGLLIEVPKGAVPEGSVLRLEVGMCLYGPFKFPPDTTPIAPVLMMCPQEEIDLKEPILVTLPHIIDYSRMADVADVDDLGIKVVKADHQPLCYSQQTEFEDIEASITFQTEGEEEYVTFSLSHFCFISLRADLKREKALRFGYCICPMYPTQTVATALKFNYHLAVTYYPRPWIEALKEQFQAEGFELMTTAIQTFKMSSDQGTVEGEIVNRSELQSNWEVDLQFGDRDGKQAISAESVDVWRKELEELENDITFLKYPPCFCVLALPRDQNVCKSSILKFCFRTDNGNEDIIRLPLSSFLPASSPTMEVTRYTPYRQGICLQKLMEQTGVSEEEISQECTQEPDELMPIARKIDWLSYAYQLGLHKQDIQQIRIDQHATVRMKAVQVLQRWQENEGHSATYKLLIQACLKLDDVDAAEFICTVAKS